MDLVSRKSYPKEKLFRLVVKDGSLVLDMDGSLPGRGIYILRDKKTVETFFKRKMYFRFCKTTDTDSLLMEMNKYAE